MSDPVALTSREAQVIPSVGVGQQFTFYIDVTPGAFLMVYTEGITGDIDLFVKRGSIPTTSVYDVKSDGPNAFETCMVPSPAEDRYYVLVYGFATATNVTIRAVTDTQTGTAVAVPILSYERYGDPASIFQSGTNLVAKPLLSTSSSENPLAAFTTHVQSDQGSAEAMLQFNPPIYTGAQNYFHLLGSFDDAFVPGYSTFTHAPFGGSASLSFAVPYTNVHAVFAISIKNPSSPAAGLPGSGSLGAIRAVADTSTANLPWGTNTGQLDYNMRVRMKAVLVDDPLDNGDGTWSHHYVVAVARSSSFEPDYSSAEVTHFWANLDHAQPLKTFALAFAPSKTHPDLAAASFDDPSAVEDPAAYLWTASLRPLSADASPPAPPPDPFWTNFVGCKEAA